MSLLVIYNPVCGSGLARSFIEEHVLPVLEQHHRDVDRVVATEYPGHAGILVAEHLRKVSSRLTIVLASGDGTLHEIINQVVPEPQKLYTLHRVFFVLVPVGTANALYSFLFPPVGSEDTSTVEYRLRSLRSFLNARDGSPLTLSFTMLFSAPGSQMTAKTTVSSVVTSTSLHASILHDSEALRKEIPGVDRFKIAAQQNSKRWYNASVNLLPSCSGAVQIYDPASHTFVNHPESTARNLNVELRGPFVYFLSTVNVDRLEPEFRITPLVRTLPSSGATYDMVIVRPLRDPSIDADNEQAREQYADKIWKVMGDAYVDGTHVNLRYDGKGEVVSEGDGPLVVEYVRCGGWEWIPDNDDERAHLLCSDGYILTIEGGGRAVSRAAMPVKGKGIAVYG